MIFVLDSQWEFLTNKFFLINYLFIPAISHYLQSAFYQWPTNLKLFWTWFTWLIYKLFMIFYDYHTWSAIDYYWKHTLIIGRSLILYFKTWSSSQLSHPNCTYHWQKLTAENSVMGIYVRVWFVLMFTWIIQFRRLCRHTKSLGTKFTHFNYYRQNRQKEGKRESASRKLLLIRNRENETTHKYFACWTYYWIQIGRNLRRSGVYQRTINQYISNYWPVDPVAADLYWKHKTFKNIHYFKWMQVKCNHMELWVF